MSRRYRTVLAAAVLFAAVAAPLQAQNRATYRVTLQNLAQTQPLSPPVAASHRPDVSMFSVGSLASAGLEAIAENGDESLMYQRFSTIEAASDAVDVGAPLTPVGSSAGGFADHASFLIEAAPRDVLSLATMLICTNDGFTGLDRRRLPLGGSAIYLAAGYDAGTEDNTELSIDVVDPCSALGPVPLAGDPNGNDNDAADSAPHRPIRHHDGIFGVGDLLDAHNWNDPVLKVTVTRLSEQARQFVAPLSGRGEVPMVGSGASGVARFRLVMEGDKPVLRYVLQVRDVQDVVQAHIHYGMPHENGPVAAFLFGPADPDGPTDGAIARGTIDRNALVGPFAGDIDGFVDALRNGELYVNVHTVLNPSGEIRGQIGARPGMRSASRLSAEGLTGLRGGTGTRR